MHFLFNMELNFNNKYILHIQKAETTNFLAQCFQWSSLQILLRAITPIY